MGVHKMDQIFHVIKTFHIEMLKFAAMTENKK